jgi:hypothetical protein
VKNKFKFEGLKDMLAVAEKGYHAIFFDLTSGYDHVELHPRTRTYTSFKWKGSYYFYNCLPFGFATAPWVFSKVMQELVMYWRKGGINVLLYLDDFFFSKKGKQPYVLLYRRIKKDFFETGLIINEPKCSMDPVLYMRQSGFDVDMGEGEFRVPVDRWEAKTDAILSARVRRVQARKLSSLPGIVISMKLAWEPDTQLYYTKHMCLVKLGVFLALLGDAYGGSKVRTTFLAATATSPLRLGHLAPQKGLSIKVATDASGFAWGGHTMTGPMEIARGYFSEWEAVQSSTYMYSYSLGGKDKFAAK